MEEIYSSQTSLNIYRTTRRHISDDNILHSHRCKDLKSKTIYFLRHLLRALLSAFYPRSVSCKYTRYLMTCAWLNLESQLRRLVVGFSPLGTGFSSKLVHAGCVVGRIALEQDLLRAIRHPLWIIIPEMLHIHQSSQTGLEDPLGLQYTRGPAALHPKGKRME